MQFSVVIPVTDQNASLLSFTLDSLAEQVFEAFEVILVDGRSTEYSFSPLEVSRYHIAHLCHTAECLLSVMLNKGIDLAQGKYLHFLQPGEFYISRNVFRFLREFTEQNPAPDLVYTGCIVRHSLSAPERLFNFIEEEDLKGAKVPPGLQAYWFRKEALVDAGKFDERYRIQGGFDLLCRFYRAPQLGKVFMRRILTDYEYRLPRPRWIMRQLFETLLIISRQFGFSKAIFSWIGHNHLRFFKWWAKIIKGAFWKKPAI